MILVLTAISLVLGLTLFAVLAAMVLRAIIGADHPGKGTGWAMLDGITTLAELVRLWDFDPPDFS